MVKAMCFLSNPFIHALFSFRQSWFLDTEALHVILYDIWCIDVDANSKWSLIQASRIWLHQGKRITFLTMAWAN